MTVESWHNCVTLAACDRYTRECLCFAKCTTQFSVCDDRHHLLSYFRASHICFSFPSTSVRHLQQNNDGHTHCQSLFGQAPKHTAVVRVRIMAAQVPLWQQIVTSMDDSGLKNIFTFCRRSLAVESQDSARVCRLNGGKEIRKTSDLVDRPQRAFL